MAAPTIQLAVNQSSSSQPYQPVTVTASLSREKVTAATDWTQSPANTNEYYYSGASLSANTLYKVRAAILSGGVGIKMREGTVGSLSTFGYGWGDNDSLGADTLYIRMDDSLAPAINEVIVSWDESSFGDSNRDCDGKIEWWLDLTDGDTATAVAAWDTNLRYTTDQRTGNTIDMAGSVPTATADSVYQGSCYIACLPAGTLSLKCKFTNGSGETTTATQSITVASDTRTVKTVQASGGDYTTIAAAIAAAAANWRIEIEDGHTENASTQIQLDAEGVHVKALGTASISHTGTQRLLQLRQDHCTIEGVTFTTTQNNGDPAIQVFRPDNCAVVNCIFEAPSSTQKFSDIISMENNNQTTTRYGFLLQGCSAEAWGDYGFGGNVNQGSYLDLMLIGNDFTGDLTIDATGPSANESVFRDVGNFHSQNYLYNKVREMSKDGIRVTQAQHTLVHGNYFLDGVLRIGESGNTRHKAYETRITGNLFVRNAATSGLACISLNAGIDGCTATDNVIQVDTVTTIDGISGNASPGSDTTHFAGYRGHTDIHVYHNTIEMKAGNQNAILGTGGTVGTYTIGCEAKENQVLTHAGYAGTEITANAWTVANNDTATGTLNDSFYPSVDPSSATTQTGSFATYYNVVRDTTSFRGATGSEPTAAAGGERSRDRSRLR